MSIAPRPTGYIPKPGKRKKRETLYREGRKIIRNPEEWDKERQLCHDRHGGRCRKCWRLAPLHDVYDQEGDLVAVAGHAHHPKGRKVRDDSFETLEWLCWRYHRAVHMPAMVVPRKVRRHAAGLVGE
jgi:hypothetical protein